MLLKKPVLEACIETLEEGIQVCQKGVHQLEVCSRLDLDGLTPSTSFVNQLSGAVKVPLKIMIRPRGGDFFYTQDEIASMVADISRFKASKVDGFVTGALVKTEDGDIKTDMKAMIQLCKAAFPFPVTMHKAIDCCTDIRKEVQALKGISNVRFILTSGGQAKALSATAMLCDLQKIAGASIEIIAAGKVTQANIDALRKETGLTYFHGRNIV
jgi:copper homeostasis protein